MYAVHLRLIAKLLVDFLPVINEVFFARCYSLGAKSEYQMGRHFSEAGHFG